MRTSWSSSKDFPSAYIPFTFSSVSNSCFFFQEVSILKLAAKDRSYLVVRNVSLQYCYWDVSRLTYVLQNVLPLPEPCCGTPKYFSLTRPLLPWIPIRKRLSKLLLIPRQRVGLQLPSPIGYRPFKMQISCTKLLSSLVVYYWRLLTSSYFIQEGRVSESGTHDQLIAKRGDYYEYVQLQSLSRHVWNSISGSCLCCILGYLDICCCSLIAI